MATSFSSQTTEDLIDLNNNWLNQFDESDKNITNELEKRGITTTSKDRKATYDYSGAKVKKAGDPYSDVFGGKWESKKDIQQAQDFMRLMEDVKKRKDVSGDSLLGGSVIRKIYERDKEKFEEKYGIDDYEMLDEALDTGWKSAKVPSRLSNEEYLDQMGNNLFAYLPNYAKDFQYDTTVDETDTDLGLGSYRNMRNIAGEGDPWGFKNMNLEKGIGYDEGATTPGWKIPGQIASGALNWGLDKLGGIPFVGSAINAIRNYEPNQIDVMNRGIVSQLGGMGPFTGRDRFGTNVVSMFGNYQQKQEDVANFYNTERGRELINKWDYHKDKAGYANAYLKKNPIYQDWKTGLGTSQGTLGDAQVTDIGGGWTRTDQPGGGATFTGSGGQTHQGYSNTPEGYARAAETEGTFNRGGRISKALGGRSRDI